MKSITKKDIKQAFSGYEDSYSIVPITRGKVYRINYYTGFHSSNILYSLLRHNITEWEPLKQTFIITVSPNKHHASVNVRIVEGMCE